MICYENLYYWFSWFWKNYTSKKLSKKYNISYYELDKVVYDDNDHVKRDIIEVNRIFNNILKKDSWIIEDVGRGKFEKGKEMCDKIYYLRLSKSEILKRVVLRWYRQRIGKESYNYPPTIYQFFDMVRCALNYLKKEPNKIRSLEPYADKVVFLSKKDINNL